MAFSVLERREYRRIYHLACPEIRRRCSAIWKSKNADKVKRERRKYCQLSKIKKPEKYRELARLAARRRRSTNVNCRIKDSLRHRVNMSVKHGYKSASTISLLGCSLESFKLYLESLFQPGMSWENYGKGGWHIDHIMPCAIFDLTKSEHQHRCFHFSNMRPLWQSDNCKKNDKIITNQFNLL